MSPRTPLVRESGRTEIIRLVEQSHLPVTRTLRMHGILRTTFYRWYDRCQTEGPETLADRSSRPTRVWTRIPGEVRQRVVRLALGEPELSPRELAVRFTETEKYFISEASVYRLLKAHDLITSPAFIAMKAAEEVQDKTTRPNQFWQTDVTYLKVIGWGWFYLSTVLDHFSRVRRVLEPVAARASPSPGSSARPCVRATSPTPSSWRSDRRG